jgi:hypothetical protein
MTTVVFEPDPDVTHVRDADGEIWRRNIVPADTWSSTKSADGAYRWAFLVVNFGPMETPDA